MSDANKVDVAALVKLARETKAIVAAPGVTEAPWIRDGQGATIRHDPSWEIVVVMHAATSLPDAALIAHGRAALPTLADGVLAMAAEIDQLRAELAFLDRWLAEARPAESARDLARRLVPKPAASCNSSTLFDAIADEVFRRDDEASKKVLRAALDTKQRAVAVVRGHAGPDGPARALGEVLVDAILNLKP